MRQAAVMSQFLKRFAEQHPRLAFKGMRQLRDDVMPPYQLVLRVALGQGQREVDLYIVVLGEGHPDDVRRVLGQLQPLPADDGRTALQVMVAPQLADDALALCSAANVGAIDLAGNALLDAPGLYYCVSGRDAASGRRRDVSAPFRGKAERVARRLLLERGRDWTMRELAAAAETSLGLASMTTTALAAQRLVAKSRQGLSAHDPTLLLDAWAEAYDLRRSPFVIYRSTLDMAQIEVRLREQATAPYALTLWSAYRHLMGENVRERYLALFWAGPTSAAEELLHLNRRVGSAYLFLFQPYDESLLWGAQADESGVISVNPLQLYLDLGSGDEQELALAQQVRARLLGY
ncbi:MAG: hypothetical protein GXY68_01720 [Chloroflexi bacterium]|nr:hypothetical protein [Chloroflexota bacterium]